MFQIHLENGATPLLVAGSNVHGYVLAVWKDGTEWVIWQYFLKPEFAAGLPNHDERPTHYCEYGHYFRDEPTAMEAFRLLVRDQFISTIR